MTQEPLLRVRGPRGRLRRRPGALGRRSRRAAQLHRVDRWSQRRRQDHAAADAVRHGARQGWLVAVRRQGPDRIAAGRHRGAGHFARAGGPAAVPHAERARQPAARRLSPRRPGGGAARSRLRVRDVPGAARARRAGRQHAVGRRTADVRDRPRDHVAAQAPDDRRIVARASRRRSSRRCAEGLPKIREQNVSILLVEQDVATAFEISDYGYVLESGRIKLHGRSSELLARSDVRDVYLAGSRERH